MQVLQLRDDWISQQVWVDRAEEDLISALSMYKRNKCVHIPYNNICYLFLQGIEKWLKLLVAVTAVAGYDGRADRHNIGKLYDKACLVIPELESVRTMLENTDSQVRLLQNNASDSFRYFNQNDAEECAELLQKVAHETRYHIKQFLRRMPASMEETE